MNASPVRFILDGNTDCPLTRNALAKRVPAGAQYQFDRERIRRTIQTIVEATARTCVVPDVAVMEIYSANRYCAAIHFKDDRSVIFDYGFVELLADSMALEFLSNKGFQWLAKWNAAGRPEKFDENGDPGSFVMDGVTYLVTGSMMMRDLASKLVEDIVPDPKKRARLLEKLLWPTDDGGRPNAVFVEHLMREGTDVSGDNRLTSRNLHEQITLIATFVACHELSHLTFPPQTFETWRSESYFGQGTMAAFDILSNVSLPLLGGEAAVPAEIMKYAFTDPAVVDRARREALVDMNGLSMLLDYEISLGTSARPEDWNVLLANLFSQVAMANSLIIFRNHMAAAIRMKRVDGPDIQVARGETLLRNFLILSYMLCVSGEATGQRNASDFISKIDSECFHLERRFRFFQIDITNGIEQGEDGWRAFIESALE